MSASRIAVADELARIVSGEHRDPHRVLGPHADGDAIVIRAYRPDAAAVGVLVGDTCTQLRAAGPPGLFEGTVDGPRVPEYRLRVTGHDGAVAELDDPYRFWPTVG